MLKFMNDASTVLVTAAHRVAAPVRSIIERQEERAILARLMDGGDHLLNDIGLTRSDIEAMLRQTGSRLTLADCAADPQLAACALH
jgi:uncharacterized protein YjiS (DUF1127 family)